MPSPYSPPPQTPVNGPEPRLVPGYASRFGATLLATWFAAIVLVAVLRVRLVVIGHSEAENPIEILIGTGVWLAGLAAVTAFLWRLGNHFLHPGTHGFGVLYRQKAASILAKHQDVDFTDTTIPDPTYAELSLRELLRTYSLMDHSANPDRLAALLAAIRTHIDPPAHNRG